MRERGTGTIEWRKTGGARILYVDLQGIRHRETVAKSLGKPARLLTREDCQRLLNQRLAEIHLGTFVSVPAHQRTMADLIHAKLAALEIKHQLGRIGSFRTTKICYDRLARWFGSRRVASVTAHTILEWQRAELAAGAAPGTVKLLTDHLNAIFNYAVKSKMIPHAHRPYTEPLQVENVRLNFHTPEETAHLMACAVEMGEPIIADVIDFARLTGWRHATIMGLTWAMVYRREGEIRIPSGKAGAHTLDVGLSGNLAALIEKRWAARALCPYVFHRKGRKFAPSTFYKYFHRVRDKAGFPDSRLHDFRRVAYRDLKRAKVDTFTAMQIAHHKSTQHAKRYNMLRETDHHRAALVQRDAYLARVAGQEPER